MLPLQQGGCGIEWEEARNVIKNLSMNSLSCQPVFQDADAVVSEINVLSGGTSRVDGAGRGTSGKGASCLVPGGPPATLFLLLKNSFAIKAWPS